MAPAYRSSPAVNAASASLRSSRKLSTSSREDACYHHARSAMRCNPQVTRDRGQLPPACAARSRGPPGRPGSARTRGGDLADSPVPSSDRYQALSLPGGAAPDRATPELGGRRCRRRLAGRQIRPRQLRQRRPRHVHRAVDHGGTRRRCWLSVAMTSSDRSMTSTTSPASRRPAPALVASRAAAATERPPPVRVVARCRSAAAAPGGRTRHADGLRGRRADGDRPMVQVGLPRSSVTACVPARPRCAAPAVNDHVARGVDVGRRRCREGSSGCRSMLQDSPGQRGVLEAAQRPVVIAAGGSSPSRRQSGPSSARTVTAPASMMPPLRQVVEHGSPRPPVTQCGAGAAPGLRRRLPVAGRAFRQRTVPQSSAPAGVPGTLPPARVPSLPKPVSDLRTCHITAANAC